MLEGVGDAVFLHDLAKAISKGVSEAQAIVQGISQLQKQIGRPKRSYDSPAVLNPEVAEAVKRYYVTWIRMSADAA